jgi:hypothetical protein
MKKLFYTILFCLPFTLFAQETAYTDEQLLELLSPAGEVHNEGLDFIFEEMRNAYGTVYNRERTLANRTELFNLIDKSTVVLINRRLEVKGIETEHFLENDMNNLLGSYLEFDLPGQVHVIDGNGKLSPQYYEATSSLGTLMASDADCIDQEEFNKLGREKIGKLTDPLEKVLWAASVSIAYHSKKYWKENAGKWTQFFGTSATAKADPGRDIAKADVSGMVWGAAAGATWGAIGGTVVFPGAGTITGAAGVGAAGALTGGIASSGKAAVSSLVNWLFGK